MGIYIEYMTCQIEKIIKCPNDTCNTNYHFKGRPKKDNSSKGDIFQNCRVAGNI